ncbi:50S ribosomal protein L25/general stress protein Ctc [Pelistega europaea]|uniref:Large ribosomal subunit protein bL25 n=1 Tax=Pelistega europaea TaxID=106147 RepID=A0A7Y4LDK2_9BURK|nr:50S ribosomal protein L25/general stress protein Ctc [Pelistega europaea]NOL50467.1 50S ribosomal protein L25/general stress protein Ctc [Pelistega europaea]
MKFSATTRSVQGSSASRRLRRAGRLPGIVYGGKGEATSIELDHNEIFHAVRKEDFHSSVLEMNLDGKVETVLLRAVQWHAYKPQVLHIDFQRVDANQKLHTKVPFHFVGAEESPAVKGSGNQVAHIVTEIEVSCLPKDLPHFVEVDLSKLEAGGVVHLSDVAPPKGVEFIVHGDDPVLASAVAPKGAVEGEEESAEEAAPAAEPPAAAE